MANEQVLTTTADTNLSGMTLGLTGTTNIPLGDPIVVSVGASVPTTGQIWPRSN